MLRSLAKCLKCPAEIFCISETLIEISVANAQFHIHSYRFPPMWQHCDKIGRKTVNIRGGFRGFKDF